jgi:hypothetical protein
MNTTDEAELQRKVAEVEAIYKNTMDALNKSRAEQFRIIDEYISKLKEHRLQELRDIISGRKTNPQ